MYEFKFPDVGEGIHEGEIVKWFVKEGDKIKADQPLGEIETDKAIVEMPSPKAGTILKLHVPAGGIIHVGETMVTILEEGENAKDVPYTGSVVGFLEEAKDVKPISATTQTIKAEVGLEQTARETSILATPAVRNLAKQLNVDLANVKGSGQQGRITIDDVQKVAVVKKEEPTSGIKIVKKYDFFGYLDRVPLRGIKKTVATKMAESIFTSAQLTNMHEADITELALLREKEKSAYEKEGIKITFMPFISKAVALSLKEHPYLNSSLEGEEIVLKKYYNIGIATDTEEGLMVPVVKGIHDKDIKVIAKDIDKLASDARGRKINLMDLKGGTFTISNLGSVGVEFFTPIINHPESAILGVGRIMEKPVVRNGKIEIRKMLSLSLTYDHRIVDGAQAARFMVDVIKRLENCKFE